MPSRITIIRVRKSSSPSVNEELQWLGNSLGLFGLRDKDSSCFRVFITLVKTSRANDSLTSDEIAERLHLTRGTVIHHLTKLIDAGLVTHEREGYILREPRLHKLISDMRFDMERMLTELEEVAKDIDEKLG